MKNSSMEAPPPSLPQEKKKKRKMSDCGDEAKKKELVVVPRTEEAPAREPSEEEVEEFFAILRRMRDAVKYFGKSANNSYAAAADRRTFPADLGGFNCDVVDRTPGGRGGGGLDVDDFYKLCGPPEKVPSHAINNNNSSNGDVNGGGEAVIGIAGKGDNVGGDGVSSLDLNAAPSEAAYPDGV